MEGDLGAEVHRHQLGHLRFERSGDVAHASPIRGVWRGFRGRARRGPRRNSARCRATRRKRFRAAARRCWRRSAGCACVSGRSVTVRFLFALFRFPPPGTGRLLALELSLFAAAEGRGSFFLGRRRRRHGRRGGNARGRQPAARRAAAEGPPAAAPCEATLFAASAAIRLCSCLRMCSESGFVPALPARMASGGSLMSGFCGAGSAGFDRNGRLDKRQRRQFDRGAAISFFRFSFSRALIRSFSFSSLAAACCFSFRPFRLSRPLSSLAPLLPPFLFPLPASSPRGATAGRRRGRLFRFLLRRGGFFVFGRKNRDFARARAGGGNVVLATEGRRRGRFRSTRRRRGRAELCGLAPADERHDRRYFFVGQAGQRGALSRDTRLVQMSASTLLSSFSSFANA